MSKRSLLALLGLALTTAPLTVVTVGVAGAAGTRTVTLKNIDFSPRSLKISRGSKVAFAFRDGGTTHNVTSTGGRRFRTVGNRSSGSPSRTFARAGTYRYECTLHPGMTGRIIIH